MANFKLFIVNSGTYISACPKRLHGQRIENSTGRTFRQNLRIPIHHAVRLCYGMTHITRLFIRANCITLIAVNTCFWPHKPRIVKASSLFWLHFNAFFLTDRCTCSASTTIRLLFLMQCNLYLLFLWHIFQSILQILCCLFSQIQKNPLYL